MVEGFLNSCRLFPDRHAIHIDGRNYTYAELKSIADGITSALSPLKNKFVGVFTDNNIHTYAAILGTLLGGNGFVPLNTKFPDARLDAIMRDAGITTVVCCESSAERLRNINNGLQLIIADKIAPAAGTLADELNGPGYILYTSGSTGVPKGIPITRDNFRALNIALAERYSISENDSVLQAFELSFDVSLACCFMAWEKGARLVVADLSGITAVNAFKSAYEQKCTFVTLPPSALFYLKRLKIVGSVRLPDVHTTLFTGEALQYAVARDWKNCATQSVIENAYGPTETTVWCLYYKLDETTEQQLVNGLVPIGDVPPNLQCRIVDANGIDVASETRGELWVGGDQIFYGYSNNPEKTKEVLFTDEAGIRWYKTGDIVVRNAQGNIVYVNRKDNQVQVNGYRVELGEVEFAVRKASGKDGVVVVAIERNNVTELHAFVEGKFDQQALNEKLSTLLPAYMIPRSITGISSLPLNTNGKVDKLALKQQLLS